MRHLSYLFGFALIALVGCGPGDTTARDGGHMLERSQQQLEEAKKRAQELADAAAMKAKQIEQSLE